MPGADDLKMRIRTIRNRNARLPFDYFGAEHAQELSSDVAHQ
jgi:hypothetical protein